MMKSPTLQPLFSLIIPLLWASMIEVSKGGYILTAPSVFDSGSTEKICITFTKVRTNGKVAVKLNNVEKIIRIDLGGNKCFELDVPLILSSSAVLTVNGDFKDGYVFKGQTIIKIRKKSNLSFIETDKTIYNPGQKVRFRVFCMDSKFKPSETSIESITINDPSDIPMMSWNKSNSKHGLADLEFQLSDNPTFGRWTIIVKDQLNTAVKKAFKVSAYGEKPVKSDIFNFFAEDVNDGTRTSVTSMYEMPVERNTVTIVFLSKKYIKPGLPYYADVLIVDNKFEPLANEKLRIHVYMEGKREINGSIRVLTSDKDGLANFIIEPTQGIQLVKFTISAGNSGKTYKYLGFEGSRPSDLKKPVTEIIKSWYSPSNSYIQIQRPISMANCNEKRVLYIDYRLSQLSTPHVTFNYQVIARNDIIDHSTHKVTLNEPDAHQVSSGTFQLSIQITPIMSPALVIIVYFIHNDGEVVSDSEKLNVQRCYSNEVDIKFEAEKVLPGSTTNIELKADLGSLCAIKLYDSNNQLLSNDHIEDNVTNLLLKQKSDLFETLLTPRMNDKVQRQCPKDQQLNLQPNPHQLAAVNAFDDNGIVTLTDLQLTSAPCKHLGSARYSGARTQSANIYNFKELAIANDINDDTEDNDMEIDDFQDYLSDIWLWELVSLEDQSYKTIKSRVPHSNTKWIGEAICVSPSSGFGISAANSIIAFQRMFLKLTMPNSTKVHEIVTINIMAFSYSIGCFPIRITLQKAKNIVIIGHRYKEVCLCNKKPHTEKFTINLAQLGKFDVTVKGIAIIKQGICPNHFTKVQAEDKITQSIQVQIDQDDSRDRNLRDASYSMKLEVSSRSFKNDNRKKKIIVCGTYNGPFSEAKMPMVEVDMVPGYAPDHKSLSYLKKYSVSRFEVNNDGKVTLYIEKMERNRKKCFQINVTQMYVSTSQQSATVKFYDYYQPELEAFRRYEL